MSSKSLICASAFEVSLARLRINVRYRAVSDDLAKGATYVKLVDGWTNDSYSIIGLSHLVLQQSLFESPSI